MNLKVVKNVESLGSPESEKAVGFIKTPKRPFKGIIRESVALESIPVRTTFAKNSNEKKYKKNQVCFSYFL